jgi:hypothetical protein
VAEQDYEPADPRIPAATSSDDAGPPDREPGKTAPRGRSLSSLEARVREETSRFNFGTLVAGAGGVQPVDAVVVTGPVETAAEHGIAPPAELEAVVGVRRDLTTHANYDTAEDTARTGRANATTPVERPSPRPHVERIHIEHRPASGRASSRAAIWFLVGMLSTAGIGFLLVTRQWQPQAVQNVVSTPDRVIPQASNQPAGLPLPDEKSPAPVGDSGIGAKRPDISVSTQEPSAKAAQSVVKSEPKTVGPAAKLRRAERVRTVRRGSGARPAPAQSATAPAAHPGPRAADTGFDRNVNTLVNKIP